MARNREKKGSLVFQLQQELEKKLAIGQSKFEDKKLGLTVDKIYSWNTFRAYLKHGAYFLSWAKEQYGVKTLEQAKPYINKWLEQREKDGMSAYTLKLEISAMAKIYSLSSEELYKSQHRLRADIQRSRGDKVRDKHFSEENHKELIRFCQATGLRRGELTQIKGTDLIIKNNQAFLQVTRNTKGGRPRLVPLILDTDFVQRTLEAAGQNKVFPAVPNGADIHGYRANFATSLYKQLARDIKELPKEDKYICRKDLKGVIYDKKAMLEVSRALGHNRISVIAGHYIRRD